MQLSCVSVKQKPVSCTFLSKQIGRCWLARPAGEAMPSMAGWVGIGVGEVLVSAREWQSTGGTSIEKFLANNKAK